MAGRWWTELSAPDVAALAEGTVGLVPVGATQHHGDHLPLGTDGIVARAVCAAASARCGAPVLPAFDLGCGEGPGSLHLAPAELTALARRCAVEAGRAGLGRLLFVNAHPGNAAALVDAVDPGGEVALGAHVGVVHWWALDRAVTAECAEEDGLHGGRAETALLLAVAPELVRLDRLGPAAASLGATEALGLALLDRLGAAVAAEVEAMQATLVGT